MTPINYNKIKYQRHSLRLPNYDYSKEGLYFVTLCVENWVNLFGDIYDGELKLNVLGKIVKEEWQKTDEIRDNIQLHEFIIMPNHFHAIIEILVSNNNNNESERLNQFKSPTKTIGAIIRGFKGTSTKRVKEKIYNTDCADGLQYTHKLINGMDLSRSIWQRNYYDHIIRNQKDYIRISEYIENNPFSWVDDKYYNK